MVWRRSFFDAHYFSQRMNTKNDWRKEERSKENPPVYPYHHEKHDEEVHEVYGRGGEHVRDEGQARVKPQHEEQPRQSEDAPGHSGGVPLPATQRDQREVFAESSHLISPTESREKQTKRDK